MIFRIVVLASIVTLCAGAGVMLSASDATASHYHTTCVGHGFVSGDDTGDGSFFSRVEAGCSSDDRSCSLWFRDASGTYSYLGGESQIDASSTCNYWSGGGWRPECGGQADVRNYRGNTAIFTAHTHYAHTGRCTLLRKYAARSSGDSSRLSGTPADLAPAIHGRLSVERQVRAPDGRTWGILVYYSQTGKTCPVVGHVRGGTIGRFRGGRFNRYPVEEGASCLDPREVFAARKSLLTAAISLLPEEGSIGAEKIRGARATGSTLPGTSVVYGVADPDVATITVAGGPETRTVTPSAKSHAYLVTYDGLLEGTTLELTAHKNDGTTTVVTVPAHPISLPRGA